jgi:hypothetical protein
LPKHRRACLAPAQRDGPSIQDASFDARGLGHAEHAAEHEDGAVRQDVRFGAPCAASRRSGASPASTRCARPGLAGARVAASTRPRIEPAQRPLAGPGIGRIAAPAAQLARFEERRSRALFTSRTRRMSVPAHGESSACALGSPRRDPWRRLSACVQQAARHHPERFAADRDGSGPQRRCSCWRRYCPASIRRP